VNKENVSTGKRVFLVLFLGFSLFFTLAFKNEIVYYIMVNYIDNERIFLGEANSYYKDVSYGFVQNTTNLYPDSPQDILNIIYTALNRGLDEISFYCSDTYENCIEDVNNIADNSLYLSTINNLVHPYNSYRNIYFSIKNYGKVHISFSKLYSPQEIELTNKKLNSIYKSLFYDNMSDYDRVLAFHDYIINNTLYDDSFSFTDQTNNSNKATGLLFDGKAICSGYSDVMAIFLNDFSFNNYRISSDDHIWNLVYIDGLWKHIDVTWDDPISNNGSNILLHDFFLVSSDDVLRKDVELEKNNHNFDKTLYVEAN
jgi:hypothetical protein